MAEHLSSLDRAADACRRIASISLAANVLQTGCSLADPQAIEDVVYDLNATIHLLSGLAGDWINEAAQAACCAAPGGRRQP